MEQLCSILIKQHTLRSAELCIGCINKNLRKPCSAGESRSANLCHSSRKVQSLNAFETPKCIIIDFGCPLGNIQQTAQLGIIHIQLFRVSQRIGIFAGKIGLAPGFQVLDIDSFYIFATGKIHTFDLAVNGYAFQVGITGKFNLGHSFRNDQILQQSAVYIQFSASGQQIAGKLGFKPKGNIGNVNTF